MKHLKIILTAATCVLMGSSALSNPAVIKTEHINYAGKHKDSAVWTAAFHRRVTGLVGQDSHIFLANVANPNLSVRSLTWTLNEIYQEEKKKIADGKPDKKLAAFLSPLVSYSRRDMAISQLVLETAILCGLQKALEKPNSDPCIAYPKLATAVSRLIASNLISPNKKYGSYQDFKDKVAVPDRGSPLSRAIIPLYMAFKIDDKFVQQHWLPELKSEVLRHFSIFEREIEASLKDFYLRLFMSFAPLNEKDREDQFNWMFANYRQDSVLNHCIRRRNNHGQQDSFKLCTSNHAIAMFLGRLMVRELRGVSITSSVPEFRSIIRHGIEIRNGLFVMSDRFRTFDKTPSGIGYSMLQLRLIVFAAEILEEKTNLYDYYSSKLLKALNDLHSITNSREADTSVYFDHEEGVETNRVYHLSELGKYIDTNQGDYKYPERARLNWARNFGFYLVVKNRVCGNKNYADNVSSLCLKGQDADKKSIIKNAIVSENGGFSKMIEGTHIGPAELLFSY